MKKDESLISLKKAKIYSSKEVKYIKLKFLILTFFITLSLVAILVFSVLLGFFNGLFGDTSSFIKYFTVLNMYNKYSLNEVNIDTAIDIAIQGLVYSSKDKYGMYIPASSQVISDKFLMGKYTGLGITYSLNNDNTFVIKSIVENSPAEKAGLKENDIITHINGEVVTENILLDMVSQIASNTIDKVIFRVNNKDIEIGIAEISEPILEYSIEKNNGVISIYRFVPDTVALFKEAIDFMVLNGVDTVIFDLRNNGGGDLNTVVNMLDYITDYQALVEVKDTTNSSVLSNIDAIVEGDVIYSDINYKLNKDIKIKILVNSKTASAAELFVMAMQDTRGATIIGENTYGKSTVLTTFNFVDGSMLVMSTGYYYPLSGRYIEEIGIAPDILLNEFDLCKSIIELLNDKII